MFQVQSPTGDIRIFSVKRASNLKENRFSCVLSILYCPVFLVLETDFISLRYLVCLPNFVDGIQSQSRNVSFMSRGRFWTFTDVSEERLRHIQHLEAISSKLAFLVENRMDETLLGVEEY